MDTEEIPHPPDLRQPYPGQAEDYSSQEKTGGEDADIDSTSCTNSRGSSLSDRRDLDEFDAEGVQDELTQLKTVAALRVMQDEGDERERSLGFDLNTVCEEGKTLLWDLIQDDKAVSPCTDTYQDYKRISSMKWAKILYSCHSHVLLLTGAHSFMFLCGDCKQGAN